MKRREKHFLATMSLKLAPVVIAAVDHFVLSSLHLTTLAARVRFVRLGFVNIGMTLKMAQ